MDSDLESWILIPSLFHSSMIEMINEFSKKLRFILNKEYHENLLSGMTGLIWTSSEKIYYCKS